MYKIFSLYLILLIIIGCGQTSDDGWTDLFNGQDLTGWHQLNGEAIYEVEDGMIVGTTVANTPNSFLATDENYGDFIFELEMFLEDDFNSGIQFRSESLPDFRNGRVHGYQCEVDPSDRAWSAGIYDEARRGWLYTLELNPEAKTAFKPGEWNHYRIECIGNDIKTFLNGVHVAHLIDDMTPEGFIALQVHSIGNESQAGRKIRWRNIRIKTENLQPSENKGVHVVNLIPNNLSDAEKEQGYRLLFDGESTTNWQSASGERFPEEGWEVKDGVLTVLPDSNFPEPKGGDIVTTESFKAFDLQFEFNFTKGANSGIKYGLGNNGPSIGMEYQILDDENHPDAKNGIDGNRTLASLYDLIPAEKDRRFVKGPGEWNRGRIVLNPDGRVEHWLNGQIVVEFTRGDEAFQERVAASKFASREGFAMSETTPILIQDHHDEVHFRSIKIREL